MGWEPQVAAVTLVTLVPQGCDVAWVCTRHYVLTLYGMFSLVCVQYHTIKNAG